MKIRSLSLVAILLLQLALISQSFAQNNQGLYMKIDYLNIDLQELTSFQSEVESILKPVYEARIEAGAMDNWYLYKVLYPGSQNTDYNFIAVSICSELCTNDNLASQLDEFADGNGNSSADLLSEYNSVLTPKFSELWKINNSIEHDNANDPARYLMLDYMNVMPGSEYTYQMMEDDHAKPIHQFRIENGNMEGWELFQLILPRGEEYGYNFSTGNYYNDLKNVEFHFNEEVLRQSRPEADVAAFFQNVENVRDLVRSEVWELITYVK
jgi:hypothetical protein